MKLSYSELRQFRRCRKEWDYGSSTRKNLEPKRPNRHLFLGKAFHKAIEAYYMNNRSKQEAGDKFAEWTNDRIGEIQEESNGLWDEELEEIKDQVELGNSMIEQYIKWAEEHDDPYFDEVIDMEIEFTVDIPGTDHQYTGIGDGLVRDSHDRLWLKEYKTATSMSRKTNNLQLDEQSLSYLWGVSKELDKEIEGVLYRVVRKKAPTEITENKTGGLSKRKVVNTYENYRNRLIEYYGSEDEVPWNEYESVLNYYEQQDNPFVSQERLRRNEHEIEDIEQRISTLAKEVDRADQNDIIYKNPGNHCEDICAFKDLCVAGQRGDDTDFLVEQNYQERS